jgi:RNA polymerase sigma-32 factor
MQSLINISSNCNGIDQYIKYANSIPILSLEEEQILSKKWHIDQCANSAKKLVLSHLRLVISISRQYLGYGLQHADLIQEGNIGLMKAVQKFNPDFNVRLVTYAIHWIKAEIHEYILKNWRIVKIATTKAQRKLFFKLRSLLPDDNSNLSLDKVSYIANALNVKDHEVIEMQSRLKFNDISMDEDYDMQNSEQSSSSNSNSLRLIDSISDERYEPAKVLINQQLAVRNDSIYEALDALKNKNERMYYIIKKRWLSGGENKITFKDISITLGISIERVRQLEQQAIQYIKKIVQNK